MKRRAFLQTLVAAWIGVKSFEELLVVEEDRVPYHIDPNSVWFVTEEDVVNTRFVFLPRGYYKVGYTDWRGSVGSN